MTLGIMAECCYGDCHLYSVSFVQFVTNKPVMLCAVLMIVVILSFVALFE